MESEYITLLLCLIARGEKNNIVINYAQFTICPDILERIE